MCKWDRCSGTCYYREPPANTSGSLEHYFSLAITMAILLPTIAILDHLFETYAVAPCPFFARRRGPGGDAEEAEEEEEEHKESKRTLGGIEGMVPEHLARPSLDAERFAALPAASRRKRLRAWATFVRRRLTALRYIARGKVQDGATARNSPHRAVLDDVGALAPAVAEAVVARDEELQRALDGAGKG